MNNEEIKQLQTENNKLKRELRHTQMTLDRIVRSAEAKDALNNALMLNSEVQEGYVDLFVNNSPEIIFLLDSDGKFIFSTKKLLEVLNVFNFDFIKNKSYEDVFPKYMSEKQYANIHDAIIATLTNKEKNYVEEVLSFGGDDFRNYSIEILPVKGFKGKSAGEELGVLVVFVDATDFVNEREKAEEASRAKSDFLATMSHEIRTPMNAVIGMAEVLRKTEMTEEQKKYLKDIQNASNNLLSIINDILDLSKIEAGKIDIINSNMMLHDYFNNEYSVFKFMFMNKGLELEFNIDESLPRVIHSDEKRVNQIITNILSNALKYTPEGKVELKAWSEDENTLRVDVKDTGIGIKEEDLPTLFQPFERLDAKKNSNVVGTGLGLAICYRLVKIMGGNLWVESDYGKGSKFSLELPFGSADQSWQREQSDDIKDFTVRDIKALVVDDIEINLIVAEALISEFGIEVDTALSGKEALSIVKEKEYDLVFMDHMMPEMDGIETVKLMRLMGGYRSEVPVIALTANVLSGMRELFLEHSFDDFLPKPLEINNLKRILLDWIPKEKINEK